MAIKTPKNSMQAYGLTMPLPNRTGRTAQVFHNANYLSTCIQEAMNDIT